LVLKTDGIKYLWYSTAKETKMDEGEVRGLGPGPGRRKREKREDVKAKILESAYAVFSERGYEGASLERVAEAAGFSKGAVYSNFASKDELFFELVSARIDERIEALRAVLAKRPGSKGLAAAARAAGRELGTLGESDPEWQKLFIEFWLRCARSEELRVRMAEKRRLMRARIAESFVAEAEASATKLRQAEAMDLATTVLALSNGLGIEGIIDPGSTRPALFGELLAKILGPLSKA
jgi:AcrR family transcriptional regulator